MVTRTTRISNAHYIARERESYENGVVRRVYELERRNEWG